MRIFFWDFDDESDIERQWVMFIINFLAFIFTAYSLWKTIKLHQKILFQILPLSINTLATLVLLLIKLFQRGYQFQLVGYLIQIFTYFLFCYTFALLRAQLGPSSRVQNFQTKLPKICNLIMAVLILGTMTAIGLVLASVIQRNCQNNLLEISIACVSIQTICLIPTMHFGLHIRRKIMHKNRQIMTSSTDSSSYGISDQYTTQRKRQIEVVLGSFCLSLLLRLVVLGFNIDFDSYFSCKIVEDVPILTSESVIGQIMLILIQVNQLIPHIMIPLALYVIPHRKPTIKTNYSLQQTLLEDQDEQMDSTDHIQRRISQSILKRSLANSMLASNQQN